MNDRLRFFLQRSVPSIFLKSSHNPRKAIHRISEHLRYGHRKIIGYGVIYLIFWLKRLQNRDLIIVSPERPRRLSSLWKLAMLSGIRVISEGRIRAKSHRTPLAYIRHADNTWDGEPRDGFVNGRCTNISKSHVDAIFHEVFGYETRVDPTKYQGLAVKKSEKNFSGGGTFIHCPVGPSDVDSDFIYQRLVDNLIAPGVVCEYRVSIIGKEITDVIVQRRAIENRLRGRGSGASRGSHTCDAADIFSQYEIAKILEFCERVGLEFGELDILPDTTEGRIYILDVNKTPSYMVQGSAFRLDRFRTLYRRTAAFRRLLHQGGCLLRTENSSARFVPFA